MKMTNLSAGGTGKDCLVCGGTGWIGHDVPVEHPDFGKLFPCPNERHRAPERVKAAALSVSSDLAHMSYMTFGAFDVQRHALTPEQLLSLNNAYEGALRFNDDPRGWLLILGKYGVGKTHLAAAIANSHLERGLPVVFLTAPDLLDYLRAAFNPSSDETYHKRFEDLLNAPLLILDDLGSQNATAWAAEKLFQLINHRYVAKLPTVITMNVQLEDLDPRLNSRLADMDLVRKLPIHVPDFRRMAIEQGQSALISLTYYKDLRFNTFDLRKYELEAEERDSLENAFKIAQSYAEGPEDWLVFFGAPGCGKTHLAAAIAFRRLELSDPVLFVVAPDLLDHLRATFSPDSKVQYDQRFEEVRTASLLILDDLGTESATPWAREKLYQLLNYRYMTRAPTVITTSLSPDEMDPRIRARILDEKRCSMVPILARSYRGSGVNATRLRQEKETPVKRRRKQYR